MRVVEVLNAGMTSSPVVARNRTGAAEPAAAVVVPLRLRLRALGRDLAFFSTVTVFGTPLDITLAELAIEAFFPADAATIEALGAAVRPA